MTNFVREIPQISDYNGGSGSTIWNCNIINIPNSECPWGCIHCVQKTLVLSETYLLMVTTHTYQKYQQQIVCTCL